MPVVFRLDGCRFHFYSDEGEPREPIHIHVARAGTDAKFGLFSEVELAYNRGVDARTIRQTRRRGMNTLIRATTVRFDEAQMWVDLEDGRTLGIPLVWFPRLLRGTAAQRANFFISPSGIHWDDLDEDISIAGLLAGRGDMTKPGKLAA